MHVKLKSLIFLMEKNYMFEIDIKTLEQTLEQGVKHVQRLKKHFEHVFVCWVVTFIFIVWMIFII